MEKSLFENRVVFLMNYRPDKLLSEQIPDSRFVPKTPEQSDTEALIRKIEDSKSYPNYCRYKNMAVNPGENKFGLKGVDAIPVDPKNPYNKYCLYPAPKVRGYEEEGTGIFLPYNSEIKFVTPETINYNVRRIAKKYGENVDVLTKNLSNILPYGTVMSFFNDVIDSNDNKGEYQARIIWDDERRSWLFRGYFKVDDPTKKYVQPTFVDPRNTRQKFLDEWGFPLQFAGMIITAIATLFTRGATLPFLIEIAAELGIGIAVAHREFEKGQNVSAFFSLLTGLLPGLKSFPKFRGIKISDLTKLSEKLKSSGLKFDSPQLEYQRFFDSLSDDPQLQKTFQQVMFNDNLSKEIMMKEILSEINNFDEVIRVRLKDYIKQNPEKLKKLKVLDRLWARELTTNAGVAIVGIIVNIIFGRSLNNEEKKKLTEISSNIPDSHRSEFFKIIVVQLAEGQTVDDVLGNYGK